MGGQSVMGHERMEVQARKFYSQRNMYEDPLCRFDLGGCFTNGVWSRIGTFVDSRSSCLLFLIAPTL